MKQHPCEAIFERFDRNAHLLRCFVTVFSVVCGISARATDLQPVPGHVPTAVTNLNLQPIGPLPGTKQLSLAIGLPLRNQPALSNLLQQIYDPASPSFRQYLTPEQFTEAFGPSDADYQAVIAFAASNHLAIAGTHPNRMLVDVTGSVADIEQALHISLRLYQHPTENRTFYAADSEPSVQLATPILHISGLDDFAPPQPCYHLLPSPTLQLRPPRSRPPGVPCWPRRQCAARSRPLPWRGAPEHQARARRSG